MLFTHRLLVVVLLSIGITTATTAQAGVQLFEGSWTVKAFGNEITGGTGEYEFYSAWGHPLGWQCNQYIPRCPIASTPTNGKGKWAPLGGTLIGKTPFCTPWSDWQGDGTAARPAKGKTETTTMFGGLIPPLYRNPAHFSSAGQPNLTFCSGLSTGATPGGKGFIQAGQPVTGTWVATTSGTQKGGFNFAAAPPAGSAGVRATGVVGEFDALYPYVYSYTYATLRNDQGIFAPGFGPGSFNIPLYDGVLKVASITVKKGAAKFGGTMQMLGALTTKACYYFQGGCSRGENNWKYDAAGASGVTTSMDVITGGFITTYTAMYYHSALMQTSTVTASGSRVPWTTGSFTVTAVGRGPHDTIHYAQGFDNRNTATPSGKGTIQLVTPLVTRWFGYIDYETAGIGILRIKFIPEPQTWAMLLAGATLLGVGHRLRGR